MNTAIFPGSFDPFTIGHYDVLVSALKLFDKIYVAVGCNTTKGGKGFFRPETRVQIIRDSIKGFMNVEVCTYTDLTINLCKKFGARYIIRGLRTTTDFEMESVVAQANRKLAPDITTIFIPASQEYSFISSTVVRDVLLYDGDASAFLPKGIDIRNYEKNF